MELHTVFKLTYWGKIFYCVLNYTLCVKLHTGWKIYLLCLLHPSLFPLTLVASSPCNLQIWSLCQEKLLGVGELEQTERETIAASWDTFQCCASSFFNCSEYGMEYTARRDKSMLSSVSNSGIFSYKHRKNCKCCPVSQLIVR